MLLKLPVLLCWLLRSGWVEAGGGKGVRGGGYSKVAGKRTLVHWSSEIN